VREIIDTVQSIGAKRLLIDSLSGFEMALAPAFRSDFRESLYRMIGALTRIGVTIVSTVETQDLFTEFTLSSYAISFLSDDIVRLRYVSINGQMRKMMVVIKMRRSKHSVDMREFEITTDGIVIGERLTGYRGLTTGVPGPWNADSIRNHEP
jgi:circadian clock protein KaiC